MYYQPVKIDKALIQVIIGIIRLVWGIELDAPCSSNKNRHVRAERNTKML